MYHSITKDTPRFRLADIQQGQAMVETLLSTVLLTIIVFAALQPVIMVVNDISMNEKVFAMSRVAVVTKKAEADSKIKWTRPPVPFAGRQFVGF